MAKMLYYIDEERATCTIVEDEDIEGKIEEGWQYADDLSPEELKACAAGQSVAHPKNKGDRFIDLQTAAAGSLPPVLIQWLVHKFELLDNDIAELKALMAPTAPVEEKVVKTPETPKKPVAKNANGKGKGKGKGKAKPKTEQKKPETKPENPEQTPQEGGEQNGNGEIPGYEHGEGTNAGSIGFGDDEQSGTA